MAIRFIDRLSRLVAADAHGLVESLEDRSLLLKQHLREAELALQHKRAREAALTDELRRLEEDGRRLDRALESAESDAELALGEDRDDLARFAIRQLLPRQRERAALRDRANELAEERTRLAEQRTRQEQEFEELRARVRAQLSAPTPDTNDAVPCAPVVADEEVEMELLRRKRSAAAEGSL